MFRQKLQLIMVFAAMLLWTGSSAFAVSLVSEAFLGRRSLPVYYTPGQLPDSWVVRNAVHLIKRSVDYASVKENISAELSSACSLGRFNQQRVKKYFVTAKSLNQSRGVVVLGFAHGRGVNLHDPDGLAKKGNLSGYLFNYDRTGRCEVYVLR